MGINYQRPGGQSRKGLLRRGALSLLVIGVLGPLALQAGLGALGATARAEPTGFTVGTVYLTSEDSGSLLSIPNGEPGSTATSFTTITYRGTLPATVRLYGSRSGTGLARFLSLTITRGTGEGRGFVPDPVDYTGAGPGVVYRGTLSAFPTDLARGIEDPEVWEQGSSHSYRFEVVIADDPRIEGLAADASFIWEARNI